MKRERVGTSSPASAVLFGGLAVIASALAWWASYYSQWGGFAGHLEIKLGCVSGDSTDCGLVQQFIGTSILPAYSPLLLWLGVVVTILGLFLSRWNRV